MDGWMAISANVHHAMHGVGHGFKLHMESMPAKGNGAVTVDTQKVTQSHNLSGAKFFQPGALNSWLLHYFLVDVASLSWCWISSCDWILLEFLGLSGGQVREAILITL